MPPAPVLPKNSIQPVRKHKAQAANLNDLPRRAVRTTLNPHFSLLFRMPTVAIPERI